jgi:hypothetical protein
VEIIHVELTNEGRKIIMFKIEGQDLITKHSWLLDDEATPLRLCPAHYVISGSVGHDLK